MVCRAGGVTGIIADGSDTIAQGSSSATVTTTKRELLIGLNKDSIKFAAANAIADTNSTSVAMLPSVKSMLSVSIFPGVKWINVAPRPMAHLCLLIRWWS